MFLIAIKGVNIGTVFSLYKVSTTVIGRGKECGVRILDLMVSRRHCKLEERIDGFYIRDLNSTNKTVVNKEIVEDEKKINVGDIIEIGDTVLLFTDQRGMSVKSVEDYEMIRKSQTRPLDLPSD